jgi:hypothetical protein
MMLLGESGNPYEKKQQKPGFEWNNVTHGFKGFMV